jgi:hypothetical protein
MFGSMFGEKSGIKSFIMLFQSDIPPWRKSAAAELLVMHVAIAGTVRGVY